MLTEGIMGSIEINQHLSSKHRFDKEIASLWIRSHFVSLIFKRWPNPFYKFVSRLSGFPPEARARLAALPNS
jgi:hypothetical protein